jgi:hypothetical protein
LDQVQAINAASNALTEDKRKVMRERQKKMARLRKNSTSSREEGPSKPKGKGVDPREWGNVNISKESLDIEAQAAALRSYTRGNKFNKRKPKPEKNDYQEDQEDYHLPPHQEKGVWS